MANSVRERTRILQKLAGTNLGATLQSLKTIYISFIRPVLESAPIAILKLVAGCELLGLRRGEETVLAQLRSRRMGEGAPLRPMVEAFATQRPE
ncbi:hypothetical protein PoB_007089600 [Plakobranchus ocellatus]|uniref:Uncharacterized protein n=1 Tax=Plakobranchus ocellatus TaxID=259542 RepID=A0AAV4DJN2_9GAST|nr:hypothetical protein PoB_007089600 [Plakobranchus ocellatus]